MNDHEPRPDETPALPDAPDVYESVLEAMRDARDRHGATGGEYGVFPAENREGYVVKPIGLGDRPPLDVIR